jgi:sporulation integral membrane protein YlbJ
MITFFNGINIWATKVLPALLPFFILTKLLSYTDFISGFGKVISPITKKIYGVGGSAGYVYVMSIISGYPVGAKILSDLYQNKLITKNQAVTISSFTSTSGPLFILGTVAIGLFQNVQLGIIILISHYFGALINGIIYRQKNTSSIQALNSPNNTNFLSESMTSSISSIMTVGGFIALFYMLLQLLLSINFFNPIINLLQLIGIPKLEMTAIICGIFEVTTGAIYLSQLNLNLFLLCPIITFLISFGGLSIHAQAYCFLKNFNMTYSLFLLQKLTQAIISTFISIGFMFFLL